MTYTEICDCAVRVVGGVSLLAISVLIFAFAYSKIMDVLNKQNETRTRKIKKDLAIEMGQQFISDSHWLSEHPETASFVKLLGECLRDQGCYSIDKLREVFWATVGYSRKDGDK